jgi:hypothetical protein
MIEIMGDIVAFVYVDQNDLIGRKNLMMQRRRRNIREKVFST